MIDALFYLGPGLLSQLFVAAFLLWLFVNGKDEVGPLRIMLVALTFTAMNLLIEWVLNDYLLAATLALQWTVFVVIAHRYLYIPLGRACVTMFCFFSLMMSFSMFEARFREAEMTEEEKLLVEGFVNQPDQADTRSPELDWVERMEAGLIRNKTYAAKKQLQAALYMPAAADWDDLPPVETPPPAPVAELPPPQPTPPTATVSGMTGEAFEALILGQNTDPQTEAIIPKAPPDSQVPQVTVSDFSPELTRASINAQQLSKIVTIRNRSTDPSYEAPDFLISAVSMGSNGRFAIVNGEMLREGSIVPSEVDHPRAWRLYRIGNNQVFWQPLK